MEMEKTSDFIVWFDLVLFSQISEIMQHLFQCEIHFNRDTEPSKGGSIVISLADL